MEVMNLLWESVGVRKKITPSLFMFCRNKRQACTFGFERVCRNFFFRVVRRVVRISRIAGEAQLYADRNLSNSIGIAKSRDCCIIPARRPLGTSLLGVGFATSSLDPQHGAPGTLLAVQSAHGVLSLIDAVEIDKEVVVVTGLKPLGGVRGELLADVLTIRRR